MRKFLSIDSGMYDYLMTNAVREPDILRALREETSRHERAGMQISPEQGQFMGFLARLINAKRYLEVGVFTGYSSLAVTMAMGQDGTSDALDVDVEFTNVARKYWAQAGIEGQINLHLAPALETLATLAGPYDMMFIDADKPNTPTYFEKGLQLVRRGGLILIDNVLWDGRVSDTTVSDEDTQMFRDLTRALQSDERIDFSLLTIGDGVAMCRVR